MKFGTEYKNCEDMLNPSAEAMERMSRNILAKINEPQKKAVPFKKITYFGSAVAACAVIAVAAAGIMSNRDGNLTAETANDAVNSITASEAANSYDYAIMDKAADENEIAANDFIDEPEMHAENTTAAVTTIIENAAAEAPVMDNEPRSEQADGRYDYISDICPDEDNAVACGSAEYLPQPIIFISEDRTECRINDITYVSAPQELFAEYTDTDAYATQIFRSEDGTLYYVQDLVDYVIISTDSEQLGLYCTEAVLHNLQE